MDTQTTTITPLPQWYADVKERPSLHKSTTSPLTATALADLRVTFDGMGHTPSPQMWEALAAAVSTMEAMANGTAKAAIYLSTLEPGVGKTQAMLAFLRAWLSSPDHDGTSALICIARLDEIEKLANEGGLPSSSYAAFTAQSNDEQHKRINALGCGDPSRARILFTTHAMLERQCKGRPFANVTAFHYHGRPRDVRVYDEAILPGRTLTVSRGSIMALAGVMMRRFARFADTLDTLQSTLKEVNDRTQFVIPDLATEYRVSRVDALSVVKGEELRSVVDALWSLFGKVVSVRRDGKASNTLLEYEETLSPDIAPLLVLDASAKVRTAYDLWDARRGGIERLPPAPKDYSPLTVHVWAEGGGKNSFRSRGTRLVEGIVKTINDKPGERWLVIHHLNVGPDIAKEVRALVTCPDKVEFLNWGRHNATNEFKDCPNVILAGTLFYPPSYYEALTRLVANHPASRGNIHDDDFREIELGEHRHLILQAVCRGKVRQCDGPRCHPANAYIIAATRSGIAKELPKIFPGCRVTRWQPLSSSPRGKAGRAQEFVLKAFAEGACEVPFVDLKKHVSVADAANFAKLIRKKIAAALEAEGIIEWPRIRPTGYRRASEAYFGETEEYDRAA